MMKGWSRRGVLAAGVGVGCGRREARDGKLHLRFMAWGEGEEWGAIRRAVARYEAGRPGVRVELELVSHKYEDKLATQLAAGVGPDLFRVTYPDIGRYTPSGALIDLSPHLPGGFGEEFDSTIWAAVLHEGRPHALPFHTDTSALVCNLEAMRAVGARLPRSLDEAWSWGEFLDVGRAVQRRGLAPYGFGMNWTFAGAFRWLNFLYQRGGQLLQDDLRTAAIPSVEATETLEWTQGWFREGLVPASTTVKSAEAVDNLFRTGVIGMMFDVGVNGLRFRPPRFPWGVVPLPRDRHAASELGGSAIGVSRDCRHRDEAVEFARFLTGAESMREFVLAAQYLPVRRALQQETLPYRFRPDAMRVFQAQATTMPPHLVRTVTRPGFGRVHRRLENELNMAFSGGQAAEPTLRNVAAEVRRVFAS